MLSQCHPAEPVSAKEEDGAEADGEVPVGRRRKSREERAEVVPGNRPHGLARNRWHRRKRCGDDRGQAEERCRDRRGDARSARLRQQGSLDDRRHRDHCRATAAVHPTRREHCPGGRGNQRDAERRPDLERVVLDRLGLRARALAKLNAAVDPGFHRISPLPTRSRRSRARRRGGRPTSRAPAARRRECGAPAPWRRTTLAR